MRKYRESFLIGLGVSMEHRTDFFMNLLSTAFPVIIQVFLWSALYQEGGTMYGFTFGQMMVYVFIAGAVSKFVNTGVESQVNADIRSGMLGAYLVRPVSYLGFRFAYALGNKLFAMLIMAMLTSGVMLGLNITGLYSFNAAATILFLPALLLGLFLNFFLFTLISFCAFWITEAGRLFHSVSIIVMVISGGVFPVDIFGQAAKRVLNYMPFTYTIGFPIRVATGNMPVGDMLMGLLYQAVWIMLLAVLSRLIWAMGIKKFSAVGG